MRADLLSEAQIVTLSLAQEIVQVTRLRLEIHGAVQGVGFRPFVYRLASELGLAGWVINDSRGVFVEVEGREPSVQAFLDRLPAEKPALALIQSLETSVAGACRLRPFRDSPLRRRRPQDRPHPP